jgi:type I site-specific restriction endonuclease
MNEADSRAEHIDPALKAAGWGVVEGSPILLTLVAGAGKTFIAFQIAWKLFHARLQAR